VPTTTPGGILAGFFYKEAMVCLKCASHAGYFLNSASTTTRKVTEGSTWRRRLFIDCHPCCKSPHDKTITKYVRPFGTLPQAEERSKPTEAETWAAGFCASVVWPAQLKAATVWSRGLKHAVREGVLGIFSWLTVTLLGLFIAV